MKITLPTFLQVDPLAKLIAQKMRDEPDSWDMTMVTWMYKNRIKLNSHSMVVEWPAPRKFNYVSRQHLRAACSDLVLYHEKKQRERERERNERNNAKVWEAILSDAPPPKELTPAQVAAQHLGLGPFSNSAQAVEAIASQRALGMSQMAMMQNTSPMMQNTSPMMQNCNPMSRYYEDLEREQSAFMQQYLRKTERYHQDSTGRGAI